MRALDVRSSPAQASRPPKELTLGSHIVRPPPTVVTEEEGSDALSDAGSDLSDSDDKELERALRLYNPADETLGDRLYALRDMVSPATRQKIAATWNTTTSWTFWGGKLAGNAVWVVTTSALLVVLPLALSIENESMLIQQEGELLAQQQGQQQVRPAEPLLPGCIVLSLTHPPFLLIPTSADARWRTTRTASV